MPSEPFGVKEPPIHGVRMVDEFGRVGWLGRGEVASILPNNKAQLSEVQIERIARIHSVFDGLDLDLETGKPMSLERQIELFSCEGAFIEEEIGLFEHFVTVFEEEMADRNDQSDRTRHLVYAAIRSCSDAQLLGDALSVCPALKSLPELDRLFARVKRMAPFS